MTMRVPISYGALRRFYGRFPELPLINLIAERTETQIEQSMVLITRPPLRAPLTAGQGPIRGIFRRKGIFDDDTIVVSGQEVFRVKLNGTVTQIPGTVAGAFRIAMDGGVAGDGSDLVRVAAGADGMYRVTASAVTAEDFPAGGAENVGADDVCFHVGFWMAIKHDSQTLFFQLPGEEDLPWDPLLFVQENYQPDKLISVWSRGDQIVLFGEASLAVWALTGEVNPPMEPYGGLAWNIGCKARDAIAIVDDELIFPDHTGTIRRFAGGEPVAISPPGLAVEVSNADAFHTRGWGFVFHQHPLYVLTLEQDVTHVFDLSTELWSRFQSKGYGFWRAHIGTDVGGYAIAADALPGSSQLFVLDDTANDDGGDEIIKQFPAYMEVKEGERKIFNVLLDCLTGQAPVTGAGSDPIIRMRWSDDGAQTFSPWRNASLGVRGEFRRKPFWTRGGTAGSADGRIFEFVTSDPTHTRFNGLFVNVRRP